MSDTCLINPVPAPAKNFEVVPVKETPARIWPKERTQRGCRAKYILELIGDHSCNWINQTLSFECNWTGDANWDWSNGRLVDFDLFEMLRPTHQGCRGGSTRQCRCDVPYLVRSAKRVAHVAPSTETGTRCKDRIRWKPFFFGEWTRLARDGIETHIRHPIV